MNNKPKAIFLMGPTASGKTDLAIALRESLPVEVISVDSALIYKGMDIGTAKPSPEELAKAPHRLIDILDPAESYSAMNFRADALKEMAEITANGRIPLLVGGTMLYYKALIEGLSPLPSANSEVRAKIEQKAAEFGWGVLHQDLMAIDLVSANRINPNDSQRINRALEVFYITGKTMTELTAQQGESLPYDVLQFAIAPEDRIVLHQRIEQRFHKMIALGFEQEVRKLFERGDLKIDLPSIRCVATAKCGNICKAIFRLMRRFSKVFVLLASLRNAKSLGYVVGKVKLRGWIVCNLKGREKLCWKSGLSLVHNHFFKDRKSIPIIGI